MNIIEEIREGDYTTMITPNETYPEIYFMLNWYKHNISDKNFTIFMTIENFMNFFKYLSRQEAETYCSSKHHYTLCLSEPDQIFIKIYENSNDNYLYNIFVTSNDDTMVKPLTNFDAGNKAAPLTL